MAEPAPLSPEIEALLRGPPSDEAWGRLCRLLDALPPGALGAGLPELERALAAWPPRLHLTPVRWSRELVRGEASPKHRLARRLASPIDLLGALSDDDWRGGGPRVDRALDFSEESAEASAFAANLGRHVYTTAMTFDGGRTELVEFDLETGAEVTLEPSIGRVDLLFCHPRQSLALVTRGRFDDDPALCLYGGKGLLWQAPLAPEEAHTLRHAFDASTDLLYAYARPARRLWRGVAPDLTELALPAPAAREWQSLAASGGALIAGDTGGHVHVLDPRSLEPVSSLRLGGYPIDELFGRGDWLVALERGDQADWWYSSEWLRICSLHLVDLSAPGRPALARSFELYAPLRRPPAEQTGPSRIIRHAADGSDLAWHVRAATASGGLRVALATEKYDLWTVDFPDAVARQWRWSPELSDGVALVAGAGALVDEWMNLFWLEGPV